MPLNGFSVGRDIALDIVTQNGPVTLSLITKFQSKPETSDVKIKGLDGVTRHLRFPNGWTGTFDVSRQDSTLDDLFAGIEAGYYAGLNELPGTITETISEASGAVTQYRYIGVLLTLEDAGEWEGDKAITQKLKFMAEQRVKVS